MDINVTELHQKLENGEQFVFIDVREPWEYSEFNLNAQLIPLNNLISNVDQLADHKEDEIVIHCRSGARSGMAQAILQAQGFSNVRNLTGGVLAWQQQYGSQVPGKQ